MDMEDTRIKIPDHENMTPAELREWARQEVARINGSIEAKWAAHQAWERKRYSTPLRRLISGIIDSIAI